MSEWFGHRVFPFVACTPRTLEDQICGRCPFLSSISRRETKCVKTPRSSGVCTINSDSNGQNQDWIVCPYRVIDTGILLQATRRMYRIPKARELELIPAPELQSLETQARVLKAFADHKSVFVFFTDKLGGEVALPGTEQSPRFNLDTTLVQVLPSGEGVRCGQFAAVEVQTMDFHGSYGAAVRNLSDALRLHRRKFGKSVQDNPEWTSEDVEGPNISNVFKRTFYQTVFKFQLGHHEECAGSTLALPQAVWDSWQPHLGRPSLTHLTDGTYEFPLSSTRTRVQPFRQPAWIYVFDIDSGSKSSPNPVALNMVIRCDAITLSHYALIEPAKHALAKIDSPDGLRATVNRRLRKYWPAFA